LTYFGPVKSSGNKPKPENKHELRLRFHEQLSVLWEVNPVLSEFSKYESPTLQRAISADFKATFNEALSDDTPPKRYPYSELLQKKHKKHGVLWHPLVTMESNLLCELSILMLRPNDEKSVVQGGDIDGRMKTIFDSLCIPSNGDVLSKFPEHNGAFYTLLSDDTLISKVTVETDELLLQNQVNSNNDSLAQLIIEVGTRRRNDPYISL
jgi:hypothetical protein